LRQSSANNAHDFSERKLFMETKKASAAVAKAAAVPATQLPQMKQTVLGLYNG